MCPMPNRSISLTNLIQLFHKCSLCKYSVAYLPWCFLPYFIHSFWFCDKWQHFGGVIKNWPWQSRMTPSGNLRVLASSMTHSSRLDERVLSQWSISLSLGLHALWGWRMGIRQVGTTAIFYNNLVKYGNLIYKCSFHSSFSAVPVIRQMDLNYRNSAQ